MIATTGSGWPTISRRYVISACRRRHHHVNMLPPNQNEFEMACGCSTSSQEKPRDGGTVAASTGSASAAQLSQITIHSEQLAAMIAVKKRWDPLGLLAGGRFLKFS